VEPSPDLRTAERRRGTRISFGAEKPLDFSIDARGWRPTPIIITGPSLPGVAGAIQAQHNVLVDLGHFPNAEPPPTALRAKAGLP
jgi:hypothetical protein